MRRDHKLPQPTAWNFYCSWPLHLGPFALWFHHLSPPLSILLGLKRLEDEMKAFERQRAEEEKQFAEFKEAETKKLRKERRLFDQHRCGSSG